MNFADSEVVASILKKDGYELTDDSKKANLVLLNTCSIRDKAEQTVRNKLKTYNSYKKENRNLKIGLLGCMACLLYTSPSPRDRYGSRMPSSA